MNSNLTPEEAARVLAGLPKELHEGHAAKVLAEHPGFGPKPQAQTSSVPPEKPTLLPRDNVVAGILLFIAIELLVFLIRGHL